MASSSESFLINGLVSVVILMLFLIQPSQSLTCSSQSFTKNRLYQHCSDLPLLSSYLHWTYDSTNFSLNLAFVAPPAASDGWIAWAINPTKKAMIGSQALIAYKLNGSMTVNTFNISSYKIQPSTIAYEVPEMESEYSDGVMRIFATVKLTENMANLTQVWQVGGAVVGGIPSAHEFKAQNMNSLGTLDLLNGQSNTDIGGDSRLRRKNIHGVLNAVSWGILFPIGAMIARYVRTFKFADPAWFYLHVSCQCSAYVVGAAGWGTGLKLGSQSKGVTYYTHRNIGIILFSLASLQILALFLRPKKDHKYRIYWNFYHHSVGYAILILGIINVFKGLGILDPEKKWKTAYIILLIVLGSISLLLEAITWFVVLKKKSGKSTKPYDEFNGSNSRQQPLAT